MSLHAAWNLLMTKAVPDQANGYRLIVEDAEAVLVEGRFKTVNELICVLSAEKMIKPIDKDGKIVYAVDATFRWNKRSLKKGAAFAPDAEDPDEAMDEPLQIAVAGVKLEAAAPVPDEEDWIALSERQIREVPADWWPPFIDTGQAGPRRRVAVFIDADNFITQLQGYGVKFDPQLFRDHVQRLGDLVWIGFYIDSSMLDDATRRELHMAGITIVDCPKFVLRNSAALKDTVDDVINDHLQRLVTDRFVPADDVVLASSDKNFALALAAVSRPEHVDSQGAKIPERRAGLMLATRNDRPMLLERCDFALAYAPKPMGELALAAHRIAEDGACSDENAAVQKRFDALAAIVRALDGVLCINEIDFSFMHLVGAVRVECAKTLGLQRDELRLHIDVLARLGVIVKTEGKKEGKSAYRLVMNHPFVVHVLNNGKPDEISAAAAPAA